MLNARRLLKILSVAAPFAASAIALYVLNDRLPRRVALKIPDVVEGGYFVALILVGVFLCWLALVSWRSISSARTRSEREAAYSNDNHGTLRNGGEPNIAFRVPTFKGLLLQLTSKIPPNEVQLALESIGQASARDFAAKLEEIMKRDVPEARNWDKLSFNEKLAHWGKYDSATGWGLFRPRRDEDQRIRVTISHYRDLLSGAEGEYFARFLSGYCKTVLNAIVAGHREFGTMKGVSLGLLERLSDDSIDLVYDVVTQSTSS